MSLSCFSVNRSYINAIYIYTRVFSMFFRTMYIFSVKMTMYLVYFFRQDEEEVVRGGGGGGGGGVVFFQFFSR